MPTPNLMRPTQVKETKDQVNRLEYMLKQPDLQDRSLAMKQLKNMKHELDTRVPTPFRSDEIDKAVEMEEGLREKMLEGMPTQEEMRRAPHGAIGKHQNWERRNKSDLLKWKYLSQRIHAGSENSDTANFERFRPSTGTSLDIKDAFIPKTIDFFGLESAGSGVVMSDDQSEVLKEMDPEIHSMMAVLPNEARMQVLKLVEDLQNPRPNAHSVQNGKRNLSPEDRKRIGRQLAEGRARKKREREVG